MTEHPLDRIAREITLEVFGGPPFAVGDVVLAEDGERRVKIISGCYLDPVYGRLSNWWTWREVNEDGEFVGEPESGYGWRCQ